MKLADNQLGSLDGYFLKHLASYYGEGEIRHFTEWSIAELLGYSKIEARMNKSLRLRESELLLFRSVIERLKRYEPIQYIFNTANFMGLDLYVDQRVLIPRPETEELVQWIIDSVHDKANIKVLDACTGSGCIALALKHYLGQKTSCSAYDVSNAALDVARRNAANLNLEVNFYCDDALKPDIQNQRVDVLVSNPPYVLHAEKATMSANVVHREPNLALFVDDENPILFYQTIMLQAKKQLKHDGMLFFEVHPLYSGDVLAMLNKQSVFKTVELRNDLQDQPRMIKAIRI